MRIVSRMSTVERKLGFTESECYIVSPAVANFHSLHYRYLTNQTPSQETYSFQTYEVKSFTRTKSSTHSIFHQRSPLIFNEPTQNRWLPGNSSKPHFVIPDKDLNFSGDTEDVRFEEFSKKLCRILISLRNLFWLRWEAMHYCTFGAISKGLLLSAICPMCFLSLAC